MILLELTRGISQIYLFECLEQEVNQHRDILFEFYFLCNSGFNKKYFQPSDTAM